MIAERSMLRSVFAVFATVALLNPPRPSAQPPSLWTSQGRATPDAAVAITLLAAAADDGLDRSDYGSDRLASVKARLDASPTIEGAAAFEASLTAAMLRFFEDLHRGRVDPEAGGCRFSALPDECDLMTTLRNAVRKHRLQETITELRPRFQQYESLRAVLASYRRIPGMPARRVRQIELAMERLRWLPPLNDTRVVLINIPMFHLWAWDGRRAAGRPDLAMRVIVGRAMRTQTPVLVEEMTQVVFRPYWNVPASIARGEILPKLQRDPSYLRKESMEIVSAPGEPVRIRQRPGPNNALGLIKFVFPNDENVYMHGTPARSLFARSRRDFSHGCIRVEDPVALAAWALVENGDWPNTRIESAIKATGSTTVPLARPIRVILFYTTAAVLPDGMVQFADDIYGFDQKLERALAAAKRLESGPPPDE